MIVNFYSSYIIIYSRLIRIYFLHSSFFLRSLSFQLHLSLISLSKFFSLPPLPSRHPLSFPSLISFLYFQPLKTSFHSLSLSLTPLPFFLTLNIFLSFPVLPLFPASSLSFPTLFPASYLSSFPFLSLPSLFSFTHSISLSLSFSFYFHPLFFHPLSFSLFLFPTPFLSLFIIFLTYSYR